MGGTFLGGDLKPRSTLSSRNLAGSCRSRRTVCGRMLSLATARGLKGALSSHSSPRGGCPGAAGSGG